MIYDGGPRLVPSFGFHYPEREGQEPIRADSLEKLIEAVTKDRLANGKNVANPYADIRAYIEKHWPHQISAVSLPKGDEEPSPGKQLRERVSAWIAGRYSQRAAGHCELVDQEEANRRALICSTCSQNSSFSTHCPPCSESIARTSFLVTQGGQASPEVKSCLITGQYNNAACFLPKGPMLAYADKFKGELREKAPHCWLLE